MNAKIHRLLGDLHRKELELVVQLRRLSERHPGYQEVHHVAQDIARWSEQHAERITALAESRGLDLTDAAARDDDRALGDAGDDAGQSPGGAQLLEDLRTVYLHAADLSLDWELLGQGAQSLKDAELLALTSQCHPGTLRQLRWANAILKNSAPQVLSS